MNRQEQFFSFKWMYDIRVSPLHCRRRSNNSGVESAFHLARARHAYRGELPHPMLHAGTVWYLMRAHPEGERSRDSIFVKRRRASPLGDRAIGPTPTAPV